MRYIPSLLLASWRTAYVSLKAKPAFGLPVWTVASERAAAISLVNAVSVGWNGARLERVQLVVFIRACVLWVCHAENRRSRESTNTCREHEEHGNWSFFSSSTPPFFQTLFDSFSSVNKIKNIIGKMPSGLLKAVLMYQLEFSRSLGCPKNVNSRTFFIDRVFIMEVQARRGFLCYCFRGKRENSDENSLHLPNPVTGECSAQIAGF